MLFAKNSNIEILKKFRKSFENPNLLQQSGLTTEELSLKQTLISSYKLDAYEILIEKGFKINASEYKKLQNQYLKQKKKRLSTLEIESVMRKYQNTLVYLIEIGCLENLKNFKKDFLERLVTRFKNIYTVKKIVYDVHTGHSIGCVTPSGQILLRHRSNDYAIGKDELIRRQKMNTSHYKKTI